MAKNELYQFIKVESSQDQQFKNKFLEKTNYFIHFLPVKCRKILCDGTNQYDLKNHHLSVYEKQKENDPFMSQYHYTAFFLNAIGNKYRLHIYFDKQEHLKTRPIFAKETNNRYIEQPIGNDFAQHLIQFGIDNTFEFITDLRAKYKKTLSDLEGQFLETEKLLTQFSQDIGVNHERYLHCLNEAINLSEQLSIYYKDNHYKAIFRLLCRVKNLLIPDSTMTVENSEISDFSEEKNEFQNRAIKEKTIHKSHPKPSLQEFIEKVEDLNDKFHFLRSNNGSYEEQIETFLQVEFAVLEALRLTEDDRYLITSKDLKQINCLFFNVKDYGKELLKSVLSSNELEKAIKLRHFTVHLNDNKLISAAVAGDNERLLDFLLTHGVYPVNTYLVYEQLSLVQFCFKFVRPKCLSVLIKHNASLMIKPGNKDLSEIKDLPIAYYILSDNNHPLRTVLSDHFEKTIAGAPFYRLLIKSLKSRCAELASKDPLKNKLENDIQNLISFMRIFNNLSKNRENHFFKDGKLLFNAIEKNQTQQQLFKHLRVNLRNDKEFNEAHLELMKATENLSKKTKPTKQDLPDIEDLEESWMQKNDLNTPPKKEQIISNMKKQAALFRLKSDLLDEQQKLQGFLPKKIKKKIFKQVKEISELIKKTDEEFETLNKQDSSQFSFVDSVQVDEIGNSSLDDLLTLYNCLDENHTLNEEDDKRFLDAFNRTSWVPFVGHGKDSELSSLMKNWIFTSKPNSNNDNQSISTACNNSNR